MVSWALKSQPPPRTASLRRQGMQDRPCPMQGLPRPKPSPGDREPKAELQAGLAVYSRRNRGG